MEKPAAVFMVVMGTCIFGMWAVFLALGQMPELLTTPWQTAAHLAAEGITGLALVAAGMGLLRRREWARQVALAALGMLLYATLQASGYFFQTGFFSLGVMFIYFFIMGFFCLAGLARRSRVLDAASLGDLKPASRLEQALVFAANLHRLQRRKGSGVPYISHPLAVSSLVMEYGGSEDEEIGALLHDAVEDQGGKPTLDIIQRLFGWGVAEIVAGCSDTDEYPKPPWRERKEIYVSHLPSASPSVLLVSAADKLHNARTILADLRTDGSKVWERFRGGCEGTLWYYRSLVTVYRGTKAPARLVDELERVVDEVEHLAAASNPPAG